jgi:nicotinate-nucleotide adenylyltransferase
MHISPRPPFGSISVKTPLAFPGERIGIMGGSFNPPHAGHLTVGRTAMRRLRLDRVWWLVTPGNPLKANDGLPPLEARMAACRALGLGRREIVTGFEAALGTPYTAATLAFLKRRFPGVRFVWVMGADNLAGFHRWQRWTSIARSMPLAVVDRPGWRWRALASPAAGRLARGRTPEGRAPLLPTEGQGRWTLLTTRLSPISSTALRAGDGLAHTPLHPRTK